MNKAQFLSHFHLLSLAKTQPRFVNKQMIKSTPKTLRQAAVLIAIFEKNKQLHILFTLRASHLKHHAGQVCFPGGKVEPQDKDLIATALREAEEEIGLKAKNCHILGKLNSYQTMTGYEVHPIVALIKPQTSFAVDDNEVEELFDVPMAFILNQKNHFTITNQVSGRKHPVTFMPYQHYNIWGATAAILKDLAVHLKN